MCCDEEDTCVIGEAAETQGEAVEGTDTWKP